MSIPKGKSLRKWSPNGPDFVQFTRSRNPPLCFTGFWSEGGGFLDRDVLIDGSSDYSVLENEVGNVHGSDSEGDSIISRILAGWVPLLRWRGRSVSVTKYLPDSLQFFVVAKVSFSSNRILNMVFECYR